MNQRRCCTYINSRERAKNVAHTATGLDILRRHQKKGTIRTERLVGSEKTTDNASL